MKEEVEVYISPTKKQVPLPIDVDTSGFEDIMQNGIIKTKLNEDVIINRIAKELYKNPSSGIRELYNNSVRACQMAEEEYGQTDSLIFITFDANRHSITIADNGVGISKERFKKVLRELGVSDNHDGTKIGQFGMGFASYTTLSSVVTLDTHARNGDRYKILAKDGMSFQPIGDSIQEAYGTTLEMVCYNTVDFNTLVKQIKNMCMFSGIRSIVVTQGFEFGNFSLEFDPLTISDFVKEHYSQERIIHIDNDDFELVAVIGKHDYNKIESNVFLLNSPIMAEINFDGFSGFFLNIKNERKFPPMPDRDRMREGSEKALDILISKEMINYFSTLNIHNYKEFLNSERKLQFVWLCQMKQEWLPKSVDHNLMHLLGTTTVYPPGKKKRETDNFFKYLESHPKLVLIKQSNKSIISKIQELGYDVITVTKGMYEDWQLNIANILEFGVPEAKEFLKSRKETIPKMEKSKREWDLICYTAGNNDNVHQRRITEKEINMNVIRLDTISVNECKDILKSCRTDHIFVRNDSCLNGKECRKYSEWSENEVPHLTFMTSCGMMTVKDIVKHIGLTKEKNRCHVFDFNTSGYEKPIAGMDGFYVLDINATLPLKAYDSNLCFDFENFHSVMELDTEHKMVSKILKNMFNNCRVRHIVLRTESQLYYEKYSFRLRTRDKKFKLTNHIPILKKEVVFSHISIKMDKDDTIIEGVISF